MRPLDVRLGEGGSVLRGRARLVVLPDGWRRTLRDSAGEAVASVAELDKATKGPKNYWAVILAVEDLDAALNSVTESGGKVLSRSSDGLCYAIAADDQDAVFCLSDSAIE